MTTDWFIAHSRELLTASYLPKIQGSVGVLSDEDVWWQPNAASNSIGHLLLHLSGNLRQWIVCGVGGQPDARARQSEFATDQKPGRDALIERIASVVADADATLESADPARLADSRVVQGQTVTGFDAVYHAVEHFSMHTGQIIYIAKMRSGRDLGFYKVTDGIATPTWRRD